MEPRASVLTLQQTAKWLQFSEVKTRNLMESGVIPGAMKIGGTWRVSAPVLFSWINGRYGRWPMESGRDETPAADRTSR